MTGWALYRSKRNPGAGLAPRDYRLVERVKATPDGNGDTAYTDRNRLIPGRSPIFLFNLVPDSISFAQLQPAQKLDLAVTKLVKPWAVFMFGSLQVSIPQHHFVIENFVSPLSKWQPF